MVSLIPSFSPSLLLMISFTQVLRRLPEPLNKHASPSEALPILLFANGCWDKLDANGYLRPNITFLPGRSRTMIRARICMSRELFARGHNLDGTLRLALFWLMVTVITGQLMLCFSSFLVPVSWWNKFNQFCFWTSWWQPKYQKLSENYQSYCCFKCSALIGILG